MYKRQPPEHVGQPPMVHLSCFCLQLDLASEPVEQRISLVDATGTDIYAGAKQQYDQHRPLSGYSIWDGLGWLTAEVVELAGPAPLCIENSKDKPRWAGLRQVCVRPIFLDMLGGAEGCVGCCSHCDPLGGWPT